MTGIQTCALPIYYHISGVKTTLEFCRFVMKHAALTTGKFDTHFVKNHFTPEMLVTADEQEMEIAAFLAVKLLREQPVAVNHSAGSTEKSSSWKNNRLN